MADADNSPEIEDEVPNQAIARVLESDLVSRLAKFFPLATPVWIPVKLSRRQRPSDQSPVAAGTRIGNNSASSNATRAKTGEVFNEKKVISEDTVIEFQTPDEMLLTVDQPLEFADHVLVESNDGALRAEGSVVAVQYHPSRTAVAVRFLKQVPNWTAKS
jgi:hypothetical protein